MQPIEAAVQDASSQLGLQGPTLDFAAIQVSLRALLAISAAIAAGLEVLAESVEVLDQR